jgi:hypothetical protein
MAAVGPGAPANTKYGADTLWWEPAECGGRGGGEILSPAQVDAFRGDGFLVLADLWPRALIARAAAEARGMEQIDGGSGGSPEPPAYAGPPL